MHGILDSVPVRLMDLEQPILTVASSASPLGLAQPREALWWPATFVTIPDSRYSDDEWNNGI
jgi:hypothetical protein